MLTDEQFAEAAGVATSWAALAEAAGAASAADVIKRVERLGLSTAHLSGAPLLRGKSSLPRQMVLKYECSIDVEHAEGTIRIYGTAARTEGK